MRWEDLIPAERAAHQGLVPRGSPHGTLYKATFSMLLSAPLKRGKIQGKKGETAGAISYYLEVAASFINSGTPALLRTKRTQVLWAAVGLGGFVGLKVGAGWGSTREGQRGHKFCLGLREGCHGGSQLRCLRIPRSTWWI